MTLLALSMLPGACSAGSSSTGDEGGNNPVAQEEPTPAVSSEPDLVVSPLEFSNDWFDMDNLDFKLKYGEGKFMLKDATVVDRGESVAGGYYVDIEADPEAVVSAGRSIPISIKEDKSLQQVADLNEGDVLDLVCTLGGTTSFVPATCTWE